MRTTLALRYLLFTPKLNNSLILCFQVPDGKPVNQFAFNDEAKDKAFAENVIEQTHQQRQRLITRYCHFNLGRCFNEKKPQVNSAHRTRVSVIRREIYQC